MLRPPFRPLVPALALLTLTLAACGQSNPTATAPVSDPVLSSTQASVTLRLPAPQGLSAQYINQNKTTRLDVKIDNGATASYTLGSTQAPCANGFCTVTLFNLSPGDHAFTFGTYGIKPADGTTVLISRGSLTATLLAGQVNTFPLTLDPVGATYSLSSAVKQYNAASKTFGNYVKFTTLNSRSLPAFYDIKGIDSVGDAIPSTAAINAVICGDAGTAITTISDTTHASRFRVEVQTPGTHTLSVQPGNTCTTGGTALSTQTVSGTAPVTGAGMSGATIAAGQNDSVALLQDGTVRTWGYNASGQLGTGTTVQSNVPVAVTGLSGVVGITAGQGYHMLALLNDGTVRAWGFNAYGQLGNGTNTNSSVPVTVSGLSNVVGIGGGFGHSVALLADGTVRAWGYNAYGQLGNGSTTQSNVPVAVSGLNNVTAVSGGFYGTIALRADGTVRTWGRNTTGQLGNGTTTDSSVPVTVTGLGTVTGVAMGNRHSLAVLADGTVNAWGENDSGKLGNGTTTNSSVPVAVSNLNNVLSVAAGYDHSLALLNDGTVRSWGNNGSGRLGNGAYSNSGVPVTVTGLNSAISIAGGNSHSLALLADGTMRAWGSNFYGMFGNGSTGLSSTPVTVTGLSTVAQPSP